MTDDQHRSFVESNVDDSSPSSADRLSPKGNKYVVETRAPDDNTGGRAVPGDQGFLYADTPEATIYLGKKQWIQDEWTYVVNTAFDKENQGRLYETWKRDLFERIITRKIELLANYENYTKAQTVLQSYNEYGKTQDQLAQNPSTDPNALTADDLNQTLDLNFAPVGFAGNGTTRYYTAPLSGTPALQAYAEALANLRAVQATAGPNNADTLQVLADAQNTQNAGLQSSIDDINDQIAELNSAIEQLSGGGTLTDQNGNTIDANIIVLQKTNERDSLIAQGQQQQTLLTNGQALYQEYLYQLNGSSNIEALQLAVQQTKEDADADAADNPRLVSLTDAFNGIIELANVTSVHTNISINGTGSASIVLENPRNLFKISKEDILLALSEDPDLVASGSPTDIAPTISANPNNLNPNAPSGTLTYYRGRYYSPAGLQIALQTNAAYTAKGGLPTSPASIAINQYKQEQQLIYNQIKSRLSGYSGNEQSQILSQLQLTATTVITSVWMNQNATQLVDIFQGSNADPDPTASTAVAALTVTLVNLEQQLPQNLLPIDNNSPTANAQPPGNTNTNTASPSAFGGATPQPAPFIYPAIQKVAKILGNVDLAQLSKQFYRDLQVHFQGKWIVEVGDTVWIWMSSPSRTVQVLDNGIPVVESTNGIPAVSINAYSAIQSLQAQRVQANAQLTQYQSARAAALARVDSNTSLSPSFDIGLANDDQDQIDQLQTQIASYTVQINQLLGMSPPAPNQIGTGQSAQQIGTATTSPTANAVLNSTFGGLEENQFQVFEGVVTSVTGTFNGTDYVLSANCTDLSYYLQMSRILEKPSLNTQRDSIVILNDPIYRVVPQLANSNTTQTTGNGGTLPNNAAVAGRWKSGIFVTNAAIYDTASQIVSQTNQEPVPAAQTAEGLNAAHGLSVYEHLYTGLDSANLISLLVVGLPYNLTTYAANLVSVGARNVYTINSNGSISANPNSPIAVMQQQVQDQNSRLGNFQPFLELNQDYTQDTLDRLSQKTNDAFWSFDTAFKQRSTLTGTKYPNDPRIEDEFLNLANTYVSSQSLTQAFAYTIGYSANQVSLTDTEYPFLQQYVSALITQNTYASQLKQFTPLVNNAPGGVGDQAQQTKGLRAMNASLIASSRTSIIQRQKLNFLLISDQYSANINLQPYIRRISNANMSELWRSSYQNIYSLCKKATEIVDFEFYCDENGHMRFKQPTYNRTLKEHINLDDMPDPIKNQFIMNFPTLDAVTKFALGTQLVNALQVALTNAQGNVTTITGNDNSSTLNNTTETALQAIQQLTGSSASSDIQDAITGLTTGLQAYQEQYNYFQQQIGVLQSETTNEEATLQIQAFQNQAGSLAALMVSKLDDTFDQLQESAFIQSLQQNSINQISALPYFFDDNHIHRINPAIVLNESFTEQPPEYVRIDVTGMQDLVATERLNSGLFMWAGGVDYDLWHTYGWREGGSQDKPFIHTRQDAYAYCQALLSRQKSKVFSGSLSVRGDSKYRVGDCVFIEDQYMYYYIVSVANSFAYGSEYTTTLTLEFSRRPGEFIAHPFDVIGKIQADVDANQINNAYQLPSNNGPQ